MSFEEEGECIVKRELPRRRQKTNTLLFRRPSEKK
jgi:hypothetical protein